MTNRDKYVLKRNECDVLCNIQFNLLYGCICILDCLTNQTHPCPKRDNEDKFVSCCNCIREWLNEEAE